MTMRAGGGRFGRDYPQLAMVPWLARAYSRWPKIIFDTLLLPVKKAKYSKGNVSINFIVNEVTLKGVSGRHFLEFTVKVSVEKLRGRRIKPGDRLEVMLAYQKFKSHYEPKIKVEILSKELVY